MLLYERRHLSWLSIKPISDDVAGCVVVSHRWRRFTQMLFTCTQILTAVHNSMFKFSSEDNYSDIRANLSAYLCFINYLFTLAIIVCSIIQISYALKQKTDNAT